jgi:hypothetical protein
LKIIASNTTTPANDLICSQLVWEPKTKTFLPRIKVGRNWQGDLWLFLPSICKGTLASAIAFLVLKLIPNCEQRFSPNRIQTLLLPLTYAIGLAAFIFLLLYLTHSIQSLIHVVDGRAFLIAFTAFTALIAIPGAAYWLSRRKSGRSNDIYKTNILLALFWICILTGKLAFVYFADAHQTGDFRDYQNLGEGFANGTVMKDWDHGYPLLSILAARAFAFSYPTIRLFGPESIGYVNCFLQIATAFLIAHIAKIAGAVQYGTVASFAFLLWPDFLFSTPITSHDIPGYFWLALGLTLTASQSTKLFDSDCLKLQNLRSWMIYGITAVVTGVAITMLEWTRGFRPFLLASIALLTLFRFASPIAQAPFQRRLRWIIWLAIILSISTVTSRTLNERFTQIVGDVKKTSFSDYIVADSTRSDSIWYAMHPFRFNYMPVVPPELSNEFKLKKFLYEKCTLASEMPLHMLKKLNVIARPDDYVHILSSSVEMVPRRHFPFTLQEILRILSHILTASLAIALLIRIIFSCLRPLSTTEWLLYGVALFQIAAVLFLTESAGTYDAILGLCAPVAVSVLLTPSSTCSFGQKVKTTLTGIGWRTIIGFSVLALGWLTMIGCGIAIKNSQYSFFDFQEVAIETLGDSEDFSIQQSDASLVIRFTGQQSPTSLPDKSLAKCVFTIHPNRKGNLQGFLSGNQHQDAIPSFSRFPSGMAKFVVSDDGKPITKGDFSELNRPKWISLNFDPQKSLTIEIEVDRSRFQPADKTQELPVIALDFFSCY